MLAIIKSDDNILKIRSNPLAFKFIIITLCIHLIIIFLQKQKGGRFFTPIMLIPNYYDYKRKIMFAS